MDATSPSLRRPMTRLLYPLLGCATLLAACVAREPKDAGRVADLPVGLPAQKEVRGARVFLLRLPDDQVIALWGVSPFGDGGKQVRCFVARRDGPRFGDESGAFLDPCRGAWWSADGRFLGYSGGAGETTGEGPPLVRIPAAVHDGRVVLDLDRLRCLQNREPACL